MAEVTGFPSEEQLLTNHSYEKSFDFGDKILAIVFEDTESYAHHYNLDYTLRSSYDSPTNLLGGVFEKYNFYYVRHIFMSYAYVQTQMCIDEAFINMSAPNPSFRHKVIKPFYYYLNSIIHPW